MEDIFLNAFNEATAKEKAAQKAQGATANINQQSYKKCINILQKYANGQVPEWDPKDIDELLKRLNDAGFSDKALQKINPILNNAKKQLQQQPAEQKKPEDVKTGSPQSGNTVAAGETATGTNNPQQKTEQKGNAANVPEGNRNAIKVKLQGIAKELGQSEDDIIAYIKTL